MSLESDMRCLSRVPLFAAFDDSQLRLLAFGAEQRRLTADAELFRQGAFSDGGYVIVEGEAELHMGDTHVETVGPGALLGELALITQTDHAVTARFPDGGAVMKISRPLFRRMLEEYPALATSLHATILERVKSFLAKLERVQARLELADEVARK